MKKILSLLVILCSVNAPAQDNVSKMSAPKADREPIGIYVGLDYMNLTDAKFSYTNSNQYGSVSGDQHGGTSLGLLGIRAGYDKTPDRGAGYSAGVRALESFVRSEWGDEKSEVIIPEVNLKLALNNVFVAYAGANIAVIRGNSQMNKYEPGLGAQAGVGLRFTKQLSANAGITYIQEKLTDDSNGENMKLEMQIMGFNTNINYMF